MVVSCSRPRLLLALALVACRPQVPDEQGEESSSTGPPYGEPRVVDFCMDGETKLEPGDDMMDPIVTIVWPEPDTVLPLGMNWEFVAQVYDDNCVATLTVFQDGTKFEHNHGDMTGPATIEIRSEPHTVMIGVEVVDASGRHSPRVEQEVHVGQ